MTIQTAKQLSEQPFDGEGPTYASGNLPTHDNGEPCKSQEHRRLCRWQGMIAQELDEIRNPTPVRPACLDSEHSYQCEDTPMGVSELAASLRDWCLHLEAEAQKNPNSAMRADLEWTQS